MKEKTWIITEDKAASLIPYLKWVSEKAPRKKYRVAAKSLISKLRGVKDWKQLLITKTEEDMVAAVYSAFPESYTTKQEQLRMFE